MQLTKTHPQAQVPEPEKVDGETPITAMIKDFMNPADYKMLLSIMSWGYMWDQLHDGSGKNLLVTETPIGQMREGEINLRSDAYASLLAPFGGFGNPTVWNRWSAQLTPLLVNETVQWMGVPEYRDANTMAWLVLRVCAPTLAVANGGMLAGVQVSNLLHTFINKEKNSEHTTNG